MLKGIIFVPSLTLNLFMNTVFLYLSLVPVVSFGQIITTIAGNGANDHTGYGRRATAISMFNAINECS